MRLEGTLVVNRRSGTKRAGAELTAMQNAAAEAGLEVILLDDSIDLSNTIRERMSAGRRLFVAAGGDGTVNHVVQSLVHSEAVLGVIPAGSYNHFAKDLGIPLTWRRALETILSGQTRQIDVARINDRFFVNNVSIGLYPELVARREERGRDYARWKARLWAAYTTLRKFPHVTLTLESEHHQEAIRTQVLMISNNTYDLSRMGIEASRSTLSEGRLSVYWLPHLPRLTLMKFAAHYLAGRVRETPGFRSFRTSRLKLDSSHSHLSVGIDGEVMRMPMPIVITIVPQALLVRVPRGSEG
jgi:YegS/Rv2252/BmrU family lipid kinase